MVNWDMRTEPKVFCLGALYAQSRFTAPLPSSVCVAAALSSRVNGSSMQTVLVVFLKEV